MFDQLDMLGRWLSKFPWTFQGILMRKWHYAACLHASCDRTGYNRVKAKVLAAEITCWASQRVAGMIRTKTSKGEQTCPKPRRPDWDGLDLCRGVSGWVCAPVRPCREPWSPRALLQDQREHLRDAVQEQHDWLWLPSSVHWGTTVLHHSSICLQWWAGEKCC